jgi:hypothetical protein
VRLAKIRSSGRTRSSARQEQDEAQPKSHLFSFAGLQLKVHTVPADPGVDSVFPPERSNFLPCGAWIAVEPRAKVDDDDLGREGGEEGDQVWETGVTELLPGRGIPPYQPATADEAALGNDEIEIVQEPVMVAWDGNEIASVEKGFSRPIDSICERPNMPTVYGADGSDAPSVQS